jgi:hypothetical protein
MPNPTDTKLFGGLAVGDVVQIPEVSTRRGDPRPDPVEIVAVPVGCTRCTALVALYRHPETGESKQVHRQAEFEVYPAARPE